MEYTREALDRSTGHLSTVSLGNWITVTELGELYGVGPRKIRAILHHMGLLGGEKGRYRLRWWAPERGLGIRHDKPKSGHAFDVISPLGQELVAQVWDETLADYEADQLADSRVPQAREALASYKTTRLGEEMTTQMEVCWVRHHFKGITHEAIAAALEISPTLARRYGQHQDTQRTEVRRWKDGSVIPEFLSVGLASSQDDHEDRTSKEHQWLRDQSERTAERDDLLRWYEGGCLGAGAS